MGNALTTLFNAIVKLLNAFIATTDQVEQGIGMLDVAVKDAAKRQLVRSAVDNRDYATDYAQQYAKRRASAQADIALFKAQSADHATNYEAAYTDAINAINARLNPSKQQ